MIAHSRWLRMAKAKGTSRTQAAKSTSTQQIARNAVKGGPKDVKKDKRMGVGRGQKG
jgi:hypothetical protein